MTPRERIIGAAEQLFARDGFAAVGIDAVGEEAGLSGSAIYRHFAGKDAILEAIFDDATRELFERLPPCEPDAGDELRNLIEVHLDFTLQREQLSTIWQNEQRSLTPRYRRSFRRRRRDYLDRWVDALLAIRADLTSREEALLVAIAVQASIMAITARPRSLGRARAAAIVRQQALDAVFNSREDGVDK